MKKTILAVLTGAFLVFSSCKKETVTPTPTPSEETIYTNLVINSVRVTAIPNVDDFGNSWDDDGTTADIRIQVEDQDNNVLWLSDSYLENSLGTLSPNNAIPIGNADLSSTQIWVFVYDYDPADGSQRLIGLNSYYPSDFNGEWNPSESYAGVSTELILEWSE